jgi:uncharacterized phage protein (TIGR01671 family)
MREIKFRGKVINHKNKKYNEMWVYGYIVEVMGMPSKFYIEQLSDWNLNMRWEVDPKTVGQFIGQKDKKGKEIYKGDILKTGLRNRDVKYEEGAYWIDGDTRTINKNLLTQIVTRYLEVIGDIYSNPELLNSLNQNDK